MAEVIKGKLIWEGEGKSRRRLLRWQNKKGATTQPNRFPNEQLAVELRDQQENEIDVHLELENGQPRRIRPINQAWVPSRISPPPKRAEAPRTIGTTGKGNKESSRLESTQTGATKHGSENLMPNSFHNPYNFIPAPPRDGDKVAANGLGDSEPLGHDRYYDDHYTGWLRVKVTVKTPLLLPDTSRVKLTGSGKNEHRSYPVRIGLDGKPSIQPTAIKGMLRSAYEAATNSRLAVFNKHNERLAFRGEARTPIAARIEKVGSNLVIRKFNKIATLVRYRKHYSGEIDKLECSNKGVAGRALTFAGSTSLPSHEDAVWVSVSKRYSRTGQPLGFKVDKILPAGVGITPPSGFEAGWACISGPNTKEKVYERVFFETAAGAPIPLSPDHEKLWEELIKNYKSIHDDELKQRKSSGYRPSDYLGDSPGDTAWSRHIYTDKDLELREGTLCFLIEDAAKQIIAILPVMISRRLHGVSPLELLHSSLRPAKNLLQLSPADRMFGWVSQEDGRGAYRGQLRVGTVECMSEGAVENLVGIAAQGDAESHGLPLAILGQPKPQQGRFYVARNRDGDCQPGPLTNEQAGYTEKTEYPGYLLTDGKKESKSLRGRKVYPHHAELPDGYWIDGKHERWRDNLLEDKTQASLNGKFYQEYRRPRVNDQERDNQNRSIHEWVKPGTEFEFTVHVTNLSAVELGALMWLLSLNTFEKEQAAQSQNPEMVEYFHRLGGGKPLGFGSVRLDIVRFEIHSGQEMKKRYQSIDGAAQAYDANAAVAAFKQAVQSAYGDGESFNDVRFIKAFLTAASGFRDGLPIHYPRSSRPPNPQGESFEWFVNNAKKGGPKLALDDLDAPDSGLPIL